MKNPVAKYAGQFNKASIVPNAKKDYGPEMDEFGGYWNDGHCLDDVYVVSWIAIDGSREEVTLNNADDDTVTKMRLNLIMKDCTFVKVFKNGEEML